MQLIIVSISLAAIIFTWNYVWRRTLLDTTRDYLFDIRDSARQWFLDQGYALDNPAYIALRDGLNCHLRHTESATLSGFLLFILTERAHINNSTFIDNTIKNLSAPTNKIEIYVNTARLKATWIMLGYMIFRNIFLTALFIAIFALCLLFTIIKTLLAMPFNLFFSRKQLVVATASLLVACLSPLNYGGFINSRIEKYSFVPAWTSRICTPPVYRTKI